MTILEALVSWCSNSSPGCGSIYGTMGHIDRRSFLVTGITAASSLKNLLGAPGTIAVDDVLRSGIGQRKIPSVVAMVANGSKTLYAGAFGRRDSSGVPVRIDSVFQIMSMTKAVTTVAALQLVEQQKVDLDEPVARKLPQFHKIRFWRDSTPMASRPCGPHPHRPLCATC